jgi:hypothetical protein
MGRFFAAVVLGWVMLSSISFGYDWATNPGDGSPENPYQISDPDHLMSIGSNAALLNKHFVLMNTLSLIQTTIQLMYLTEH